MLYFSLILIYKIYKYETDGWEVVSLSQDASQRWVLVMKREKNYDSYKYKVKMEDLPNYDFQTYLS